MELTAAGRKASQTCKTLPAPESQVQLFLRFCREHAFWYVSKSVTTRHKASQAARANLHSFDANVYKQALSLAYGNRSQGVTHMQELACTSTLRICSSIVALRMMGTGATQGGTYLFPPLYSGGNKSGSSFLHFLTPSFYHKSNFFCLF